MGHTIGIDLGDSNFRIAYLPNDSITPQLIPDDRGNFAIPSLVSFLPGGASHVGSDAVLLGIPENTVGHPMTMAGLPYSELIKLSEHYPYKFEREHGGVSLNAHRVFPTIPEFLTTIFRYAKQLAESHIGETVTHAVIAVPDGASNPKRIMIRDAAQAAGLQVRQLINQTVAAALATGLTSSFSEEWSQQHRPNISKFVVIDVGAEHTSMSVLAGGFNSLTVNETRHCRVGTNSFAINLARLIVSKYQTDTGFDLLENDSYGFVWAGLLDEAKRILPLLSSQDVVTAAIGAIGQNGTRVIVDISRSEFEDRISHEIATIREVITPELFAPYDLNYMTVIGGGAAMPIIQRVASEAIGLPFQSVDNAEFAVALGAAIKGGIYTGRIDSEIQEITPFDLGTFVSNRGRTQMDVLVPKRTQLPYRNHKNYQLGQSQYTELVFQYIGNDSGQGKPETHPDVITIGSQTFSNMTGYGVGNTFVIDESGIVTFIVTDNGNNQQYEITEYKTETF